MINSGKKFRALRDKKNKYSNFCVLGKKNSERNKKPYPPTFKLNGWSLNKSPGVWIYFSSYQVV